MKRSELESAIRDEVAEWPGVTLEFVEGGKHPKAKLTYTPEEGEPLMLSRPYPGTPSDSYNGLHKTLGDMRRAMKSLGATRSRPEPSNEEVEAKYRKPNDGAEKRPHPVKGEPVADRPDLADQLVESGAATAEQAEIARASRGPDGPLKGGDGKALLVEGEAKPGRYLPFDAEAFEDDLSPEEQAAVIGLLSALVACGLEAVRTGGEATLANIIGAAVDMIVDGIYFGLPAEVYHAVPRLSASGLQRLCVSPATFWKGSWLDPERPELDEEETAAQKLGKAYHIARLEPDRFHDLYVRELDKADFPAKGFLSSDEKVKAALKELSQQQTVSGESTRDRAERLVDAGYEGTIFPLEKAKWEETAGNRIRLRAKDFDQIATDMERIRQSGDIAELLTGGAAEVSVFFTDRHGLPMKCRFDYLAPGWWSDLKTFDNSRGKELEQAIPDAVRYNRYHVIAVTYRDAAEAIRTGGLQIKSAATDAERGLVASLQIRPDELVCWFIFQEKKGIPNLLAYEFPFFGVGPYRDTEIDIMVEDEEEAARVRKMMGGATMLHRKGMWAVDQAKRAFVLYSEVYEAGRPWFPIEARRRLDDIDFSQHWLEGRF